MTVNSGFLNLYAAVRKCTAAPGLVFRGKRKQIENKLPQMKEIRIPFSPYIEVIKYSQRVIMNGYILEKIEKKARLE